MRIIVVTLRRNSRPLSVNISPAPNLRNTWCIIAVATEIANLSRNGTSMMNLVKTHTAVSMYEYPLLEVGNGPAKSMAQCSTRAPITLGLRRPCLGAILDLLYLLHLTHDLQKMSVFSPPPEPIRTPPDVHTCLVHSQVSSDSTVDQAEKF